MSRKSVTERGNEMIAVIAAQGGIYDGTMYMLACDLGISLRYAEHVMCFVRSNPDDFEAVIEWNTLRKGYGLVVNGVSAFQDDGEHMLAEVVRIYTTREGNDGRSVNFVRALRSNPNLPSASARLLRATEDHLEGTMRQARALLALITP